ncbi:MAG: hypothetical protein JNJ99_08435 [Crocinitomicaceae bacterium]|nr:hypothetical protein [Crocinitomicaceae bacterium]
MKSVLTIFSVLVWVIGFSGELFSGGLTYDKRPYGPMYEIVSDKYDSTITRGSCIIEGLVRDQSGNILIGAMVATSDKKKKTYTDADGVYLLKVSHKDSSIFMFHKNYGEIVIRNYDFKSRHRVVINFSPVNRSEGEMNVKKPVIYLYSDIEQQVEIKLSHPGMTFMYPAYNESWKITADKNGLLKNSEDGKTYPYLFWEAKTTNLNYHQNGNLVPGFLVNSDTLVSFFENTLTSLGLNSKEQTDFITFWAPQMTESDYVFIQYLETEQYSSEIAPVNVSPAPDVQKRIFMFYSPVNHPDEIPFQIQKQNLSSFERKGFVFVEWGGAEIYFPQEFN